MVKVKITRSFLLGNKRESVEPATEAKEDEDDIEDEEEEEELLQDTNPGPLGLDGRDVEDVLNIISQSIYREGEGKRVFKNNHFFERTTLDYHRIY